MRSRSAPAAIVHVEQQRCVAVRGIELQIGGDGRGPAEGLSADGPEVAAEVPPANLRGAWVVLERVRRFRIIGSQEIGLVADPAVPVGRRVREQNPGSVLTVSVRGG